MRFGGGQDERMIERVFEVANALIFNLTVTRTGLAFVYAPRLCMAL